MDCMFTDLGAPRGDYRSGGFGYAFRRWQDEHRKELEEDDWHIKQAAEVVVLKKR